MAIPILENTKRVLGENADKCDSRSLFQSRFADPEAKEDPRKAWFERLIQKKTNKPEYSEWLPSNAVQLHARLMSRIMINMSDGVMENAHVLLDRYGIPYIPGSAIKGCARRMALQALHDWVEFQKNEDGAERPDANDICAPCCEGFDTPAEMLEAIARIFGWVEKDWKEGKNKDGLLHSDFEWACGDTYKSIWIDATQHLAQLFNWSLPEENSWKKLPNFAGTIAFLSAHPNTDPGLELDVMTPHHTEYYKGNLSVATDTEDPVPVYFPVVKQQTKNDHFTFSLIPLQRSKENDISIAKRWLAHGLNILGIGAKTAAGYGWFETSEAFQKEINEKIKRDQQNKNDAERKRQEKEKADAIAQEKADRKAKEQKELEGLSPDEQEDKKLTWLTDAQFDNKIKNFWKEPKKGGANDNEKSAIIRALRGPRLEYWKNFKNKATKGDLARSLQMINHLNKQLNGDKMP